MPIMLNESTPLERYGHNLTRLAKLGAFAPLAGQEAIINRVFQVVQRNNKNVPLILASDETRRWAIVAEIIRRMAIGDAPSPFLRQQVIGLDYEALFTNLSDDTTIRQERRKHMYAPLEEKLVQAKPDSDEKWTLLEELFRWPSLEEWIAPNMVLERLQSMFLAMHQGSFILYINHFHRLLGGESGHYAIDAFHLLKPALSRDRIQLIGACTPEQHRQHIQRYTLIRHYFQAICLPEVEDHP